MLTVKDVAQRLRVSTGLVYKLAASGQLEHHRIGAALRFSEEHLQAYLDQSRSKPHSVERRPILRHL